MTPQEHLTFDRLKCPQAATGLHLRAAHPGSKRERGFNRFYVLCPHRHLVVDSASNTEELFERGWGCRRLLAY